MVHLEKSWLLPIAGRKKFFTSAFYYRLLQELDRKKFDAVYEGYADPYDLDSEQPDVVIYDRKDVSKAALLVEFCSDSNEEDTIRTMDIISKIYKAKEAYVYNFQSGRWFKFSNPDEQVSTTSYSNLLGIDMNKTIADSISKYYHA
jgi:hypothetical protein